MQGSRAQKEMKRNPGGGMHTAVMPRDMYAQGGSSVYSKSGFHDDWDQKKMPARKERQYADGGDVDRWMQDVHPKKGALHKMMHVPAGEKISTSALEKETHAKSPLMRKRANLALRYRGD